LLFFTARRAVNIRMRCTRFALSGELKRRRDFVAGRRRDDVTMTSRQEQLLLPEDVSIMAALCADDDDVSICLRMVGSRSVHLLRNIIVIVIIIF